MSCIYTITVSESKVVNLTFTQFNLEESTTCSYDFLQVTGAIFEWCWADSNQPNFIPQIRDGPDSTSQQMGKFCGSTLPGQNGTLVSNQNAVYMWFKSDSSFAHHGFHLTWNATDPVCGGLIRDQTHGTIKSPGYPGQYPHNRDCFWTIYAPYGKRIQFHFAHLAIETHVNCSYDFLEVQFTWLILQLRIDLQVSFTGLRWDSSYPNSRFTGTILQFYVSSSHIQFQFNCYNSFPLG